MAIAKKINNSIAQLENGTPSDKLIKLKSVYKTGKFTVQPVKDRITGWYKGVPRLSDEEKKKLIYWAEPASKFVLQDGVTFDLTDEAQRITWEWVKHCACIAMSEEECQFTPGAEFYVYMENKQAEINVTKYERRTQASNYIMADNSANYPMRAQLLGVNMDGEGPMIIKEYLMEQASVNTEKVLAIYESKDISLRLLILKAKKANIITTDATGMYRYGNTVLGMTETSCIAWMQDTANKHLVELLEQEVSPDYFKDKDSLADTGASK